MMKINYSFQNEQQRLKITEEDLKNFTAKDYYKYRNPNESKRLADETEEEFIYTHFLIAVQLKKDTEQKEKIDIELKNKFSEWNKKYQETPEYTEAKKKKIAVDLITAFRSNKLDLAEDFHTSQPFFYDKNCLWWIWNTEKNLYEIVDEVDIFSLIDKILGRSVPLLKDRREIVESLKVIGRNRIPKQIPINWIQFKNCFYDIKTDERIKPSSEYFCVNPIPWKLGENEETPILDKLFGDWVNTEEEKKLLYEIIAYCLYPDYPLARIFCLYGKGSNGKSVFLNILSKFLSYDNCCSTSLESLADNRFESAKLYTKLLCRLSEIHTRIITKTSLLKNISGGDHISIEFKNKNPFDALIYSKIIIGTNTIPISQDDTDGYFRRWIMVDFPNQFAEKRDILSEIPNCEYENLALKSITVLKRILKDREFSCEGSIENRKRRYNERANPIEAFVRDRCNHDINSDIIFSDLYNEFEKYLSENSFRGLNKREFAKSLKILGFETKKKTVNGFFTTFVEGLEIIKTTETTETTHSSLSYTTHGTKSDYGCLGCFGCSSPQIKTLTEKNNEKGAKLLHDSDKIIDDLDKLEENIK